MFYSPNICSEKNKKYPYKRNSHTCSHTVHGTHAAECQYVQNSLHAAMLIKYAWSAV